MFFQQAQKPWGSTHSSAVLSGHALDYLNGMGFDDNQYVVVRHASSESELLENLREIPKALGATSRSIAGTEMTRLLKQLLLQWLKKCLMD
ncbi:hypothetical protein [Argonema antarcticum]|uniref:hypothetical protein n=1 Tax=Argonema antarcticum TaxID=2942763 RepID=UPI0020134FE4|nr:hypothetical protein [Argonema antarcticum]MCL1476010.1 hypothetical protein [Argonema antarcticum A004/B2]